MGSPLKRKHLPEARVFTHGRAGGAPAWLRRFFRGERWAWSVCWVVPAADLGYTLTFGHYDPAILRQTLIADLALPALLLTNLPRFGGCRPPATG